MVPIKNELKKSSRILPTLLLYGWTAKEARETCQICSISISWSTGFSIFENCNTLNRNIFQAALPFILAMNFFNAWTTADVTHYKEHLSGFSRKLNRASNADVTDSAKKGTCALQKVLIILIAIECDTEMERNGKEKKIKANRMTRWIVGRKSWET